jgi:hypothetical protein
MNVRSIAVAAVAVWVSSAAFAGGPPAKPAAAQPAPVRAQTLIEDLAAGMREVLRAVTPQVSLPAIEIKLPTIEGAAR